MSSLSLFHSIGYPLDVTSEPVSVEGIDGGYGVAIITAPPSELNIFDISVDFESDQGVLDTNTFARGLEDANEHVYYTVSVRLDLTEARWLRVRVSTGDCIVACSALLEL